jgi:hypothetical protein
MGAGTDFQETCKPQTTYQLLDAALPEKMQEHKSPRSNRPYAGGGVLQSLLLKASVHAHNHLYELLCPAAQHTTYMPLPSMEYTASPKVATGTIHVLPAKGPAAIGCVLSSTSTAATINLSATGSKKAPKADDAFCSSIVAAQQQTKTQQWCSAAAHCKSLPQLLQLYTLLPALHITSAL